MQKRTKIVATIGPASESPEKIRALIEAGVNIFRFNFKHGEIAWHGELMDRVKSIAADMGQRVGTLLDLQGPSFRLIIVGAETIHINEGEKILFSPSQQVGETPHLTISHPDIIPYLSEGQVVLAEDGMFTFIVRKEEAKTFLEVKTTGLLKQKRNMNIPGSDFPCDILTERDREGLKLAAEKHVDYIALSFVRSADDVIKVKKEAKAVGYQGLFCSKIETQSGVDNIEEIVTNSEAVMVARGDLGVECPLIKIPYFQKKIINTCLEHGTPVITATQMMQSMIEAPIPTRAEISDVANAVYDGTDAVMLSGESASGKYPVEAVTYMAETVAEHEELVLRYSISGKDHDLEDTGALITDGAHKLFEDYVNADLPLKGFVIFTSTGRTARLLSRYRPLLPVYAFCPTEAVADGLTLSYGVEAHVQSEIEGSDVEQDQVLAAIDLLREQRGIESGDKFIVLHGDKWGEGNGVTTIRLVTLS